MSQNPLRQYLQYTMALYQTNTVFQDASFFGGYGGGYCGGYGGGFGAPPMVFYNGMGYPVPWTPLQYSAPQQYAPQPATGASAAMWAPTAVPCSPISSLASGGPMYLTSLVAQEVLEACEGYMPVIERPAILVASMPVAQALRRQIRETYADLPMSVSVAQYGDHEDDQLDHGTLSHGAYNFMLLSDSKLMNLRAIGRSGALRYLCTAFLVFPEALLSDAYAVAEASGTLTLHRVVYQKGGVCCAAFMRIRM
jgi:hypothetical protein